MNRLFASNKENWLLKLRRFITHRYLITFGFPVLILLLIHGLLESFFSTVLVVPILSNISTSLSNDCIFALLALYIFILFLSRVKDFVPSTSALLLQFLLAAAYLYYRFQPGKPWYFYSFDTIKPLYYADLLLELLVFNSIILLIYLNKKKEIKGGGGFFDDTSLGQTKPDKLNYEAYVRNIVNRIEVTSSETAIAIGINGKWGSGKTSFFDLMKRSMSKQQIISVNFDPWNSLSPNAIIKDFFDTVQSAIRPFHSQLPRLLNNYTDKLINLHDEGWGKAISEFKALVVSEPSLNSLYEEINKAIKAIDKKIVVYIDDLDRLDNDEIAEVIRLIRNTANFSNTFFIVAYDRNYVIAALKAKNAFNHSNFLEKIFQMEINLPFFDEKVIRQSLAEQLKTFYDPAYHKEIEAEIVGTPSASPYYFKGWIETLRDVSRLSNGLTLNLNDLLKEVVFSEFIRLEILRLKFPSVHESLYQKTDLFFDQVDTNTSKGYILKSINDDRGKKHQLTKESSEFELYLRTNASRLGIEQEEIFKVVEYVDDLFGESKLTARFRSHLSVVYPSRFRLYFAYSLIDGALSEAEFTKARSAGADSLIQQIDKWRDSGSSYDVYRRFLQIKTFDDRKDFETIVEGILYFARQPSNGGQYGFDHKPLAAILSDHENRNSKRFYNGDHETYVNYVRTLFDRARSPYTFDINFLEHLNKEFNDSFPIGKQERLGICLHYLEKYANSIKSWDNNMWDLFHSCSYKEWTSTGGNAHKSETIYPDECKKIMVSAVRQHLTSFMEAIIVFAPFSKTHMYISEVVETIFGSYDAFGDFLDSMDDTFYNHLREFKKFFKILRDSDFKNAVPYHFESLHPKPRGHFD
ncbi:P-loop NTPase fold protein [Mucilaginibacter sp. PAMB04168]|uniref:KAP family P-loop NTPase fold protein n=1 Tax=Mucilaginibacter sp. PAMB04168 TaxID=3138567 RepID=UPI0031F6D47F